MVVIVMCFVYDGYNCDVLFGVLFGRDCDVEFVMCIVDSVWVMQEVWCDIVVIIDMFDSEVMF